MPQKTTALIDMAAVVGRQCFPREQDKKHRRMIANSNERRRMQSINAGFQMLKNLIRPQDGEKLSKASVLQQAVDYIKSLEQEKTYLLAENSRLERLVYDRSHVTSSGYQEDKPPSKRRKMDTESSDEGVGMTSDEAIAVDDLRKQLDELRQRLECERQLRMLLEQQQLCLVASGTYTSKPSDGFPDINVRHSVPTPAEGMALRGSLETIVAAIQHLEGSQDMPGESQTCGKSDSFTSEDDADHDDSNSAHSTSFSSETSLQLPASELMRVVAAAEALQFFAERHATTRKPSQTFPCLLQPLRSSEVTSNSHHIRRIFHSS